jgi:hypothetical protein
MQLFYLVWDDLDKVIRPYENIGNSFSIAICSIWIKSDIIGTISLFWEKEGYL